MADLAENKVSIRIYNEFYGTINFKKLLAKH